MLRISLCLLFLFIISPFVTCYSQQQDNAAQKIEDPGLYIWDFGRVRQGAILRHVFKLKNDFGKALNILSVNTSCGCTVSRVHKKKLAPGEQTLIEVRFDSKGYSGPTQQYIYVNTDSLDKPIVRYIIKAEVVK